MNKRIVRMINIMGVNTIILTFLTIFIFSTCESQNERKGYATKAIELNNKAGKYNQIGEYDSALIFYNHRISNPDNIMIDEFLKINKQDYIRQIIGDE